MKTCELTIKYLVARPDELTERDRELLEKACEATEGSYAPYSDFHVGAAVRLDNGAVFSGSNQENAAFGAGTCAERCTLFYAHAAHPEVGVEVIAIAARGRSGDFTKRAISPCGICRQALIEAQQRAGHPVRVLLYGADELLVFDSVSALLPFQFDEIV